MLGLSALKKNETLGAGKLGAFYWDFLSVLVPCLLWRSG